jgi:hypothetical protein
MIARLKWRLYWLRELMGAAYQCQGDAIWVTGTEKHSGEPLSMFYYGALDRYDYIVGRLFAEHSVERIEEDLWVWTGLHMLRRATQSDLVVADLAWPYYRALPHSRYLHLSSVILHKVPLAENWAVMEEQYRKRKTSKDDLNKMKKAGLSYRTTTERADIEHFYNAMYVPYVTRRHGELVQIESLEDVVKIAQQGALIQIVQGERVLGAGVLYRMDLSMRFLWLGMLDDLDAGLIDAVRAGLYYFSMQFALARGCCELNLMYCVPVLNDGIHRYKRKLGAHLHNDWKLSEIVLRVRQLTPAVKSFFSRLPLAITDAQRNLSARIMLTEQDISPDKMRRICQDYHCNGLERLKIFSTQPLNAAVLGTTYGEGAPVELYDLTCSSDPAVDFCRT